MKRAKKLAATTKPKTVTPTKDTTVPEDSMPPDDPKLPKTEGWLTRDQVTDVLRCTAQTIKNYEGRKLLHPKEALRRDRRGNDRTMLVYDPNEIANLPFRNPGGQPKIMVHEPGEQAARAFEMFRNGTALDEVVIELRATPDRIDQLYERWLDHTRARLMITPEAKKAFEEAVGKFESVTDLVERVTELADTWKQTQDHFVITPAMKTAIEQILGEFGSDTRLLELVLKIAT